MGALPPRREALEDFSLIRQSPDAGLGMSKKERPDAEGALEAAINPNNPIHYTRVAEMRAFRAAGDLKSRGFNQVLG
jgi:hypothetical protein